MFSQLLFPRDSKQPAAVAANRGRALGLRHCLFFGFAACGHAGGVAPANTGSAPALPAPIIAARASDPALSGMTSPVDAPAHTASPGTANAGSQAQASELEALQRGSAPIEPDEVDGYVQTLMYDHFVITLAARNAVIRGDLEALRGPLAALADFRYSSALPSRWMNTLNQVQRAARLAAEAPSLPAAANGVAAMARACGDCHVATYGSNALDRARFPGRVTARDTLNERMDRHSWALDEMWVGLTTPSDRAWKDGATALTEAPPIMNGANTAARGDFRADLRALRALGASARDAESSSEREELYGRALATCADCHARTSSH